MCKETIIILHKNLNCLLYINKKLIEGERTINKDKTPAKKEINMVLTSENCHFLHSPSLHLVFCT